MRRARTADEDSGGSKRKQAAGQPARGVWLHDNARLARQAEVSGSSRGVWIGSTSELISVAYIGLPPRRMRLFRYRCGRQITARRKEHASTVLTILPSQPPATARVCQAQAPLPTAAVRRNRVRVPRGDDLGGRV